MDRFIITKNRRKGVLFYDEVLLICLWKLNENLRNWCDRVTSFARSISSRLIIR